MTEQRAPSRTSGMAGAAVAAGPLHLLEIAAAAEISARPRRTLEQREKPESVSAATNSLGSAVMIEKGRQYRRNASQCSGHRLAISSTSRRIGLDTGGNPARLWGSDRMRREFSRNSARRLITGAGARRASAPQIEGPCACGRRG